jgi:hypothetical protein
MELEHPHIVRTLNHMFILEFATCQRGGVVGTGFWSGELFVVTIVCCACFPIHIIFRWTQAVAASSLSTATKLVSWA